MSIYWWALILVVLTNTAFHFVQKSIPQTIHPLASVVLTYATALLFSLVLLVSTINSQNLVHQFHQANWASYALGVVIVGIEIGFLLMYRAGWNLAVAPILTYALVTIILIPISFFVFQQEVSKQTLLGLALVGAGLYFILVQ